MRYTFLRLFFSIILAFSVANCQTDPQTPIIALNNVVFEDDFSIGLPTYMNPMSGLDDKAILEYGFIEKIKDSTYLGDEIYITVVAFNKEETFKSENDSTLLYLEDLNDLFFVNFSLVLDDLTEEDANPPIQKLNGLEYIQNSFRGKLGGYGVYYKLTIFESEEKYYQVLIWCLDELKEKHKNEIESIVKSFKKL